MDTATEFCALCAAIHDEFLTELQEGRNPAIEDFIARHKDHPRFEEHAAPLGQSLMGTQNVHGVIAKRGYRPPDKLVASLNLKYRVELVGEGGQAEVHSFEDTNWRNELAVKFPRGDKFANYAPEQRATIKQRFQREARIAAKLNHPGVLPIFAQGQCDRPIVASLPPEEIAGQRTRDGSDGSTAVDPVALTEPNLAAEASWPFYVMRRIRGKTWEECVAEFHRGNNRLSRDNKAFVKLLDSFRQICQTMEHAHGKRIIHRDLKPANVILGDNNVTTVLDWGIAKDLDSADEPLADCGAEAIGGETKQGSVLGSHDFMSPEQAAGRLDQIGPRTDVFGLGATFFYLLTGQAPHFHRTTEQVAKHPAPRARERGQLIPPELDSICAKAMALESPDRYESAAALEAEIARWLIGEPVAAHKYSHREKSIRWLRKRIAGVVAATLILLFATVSAIAVGMFQAQARETEKRAHAETEAEKRHVETLLTQRQLESSKQLLTTGETLSTHVDWDFSGATDSFDTRYLDFALHQRPRPVSRVTNGRWGVVALAFDTTTRRYAVANSDGELSIWDLERQELVRRLVEPPLEEERRITIPYSLWLLKGEEPAPVEWYTGLAWVEKGKSLAAAAMSGRGLLFNPADGSSRELMKSDKPLLAVAVDDSGRKLLFSDSSGRVFRRSTAGEPALDQQVTEANTTAITCLCWAASDVKQNEDRPGQDAKPAGCWIVGDAAGKVQVLDDATLETIAARDLDGPIWSLDAVVRGSEIRIAASDRSSRIQVLVFDREKKGLTLSQLILLPRAEDPSQAAQVLRLDPGGDRLWAIDAEGTLIEWTISNSRQIQWLIRAVYEDERLRGIGPALAAKQPPRELPLPFLRRGVAIVRTGPESLLTGGDDGLVLQWKLPQRGGGVLWGTKAYQQLVGADARMAFSKSQDVHLWVLDRDGRLMLVDAATGIVLARKAKAHVNTVESPPADLAALPDGAMATAGGDRDLRFWKLEKDKLVAARKPIVHARPLISVSASADGQWIAAVDDRAGLGIWKVATGEQQHFEQLPGVPGQPLTGRTAFDSSGSWLAAFGAGVTGFVFECRERAGRLVVRRLPDQMHVAGTHGGTAMAWNPAWPGRLLFADDASRMCMRSFGDDAKRHEAAVSPAESVVEILATPDGRRLLWIEKSGLITSYDTRHEFPMINLQSGLSNAWAMALDRSGQRLAVADQAGTIEIWNSALPSKTSLLEPNVNAGAWTATDLLTPDSAKIGFDMRPLQFDRHGQIHMLVTESHPGGFRDDGALYLLSENERQVTRERIAIGNPEFDNRMTQQACALHLHEQQPLVVFRCRTAEDTPYDGRLYAARRTAPGVWEPELIHDHGNWGFYPALRVAADGQLTDVFHYSFAGFYLIHSFRQGEAWKEEIVGEQGDGYRVNSWNQGETIHLLADSNRFNTDHANRIYLRWQPGGPLLRERLPAAFAYSELIQGLPNGQPVVMQERNGMGEPARLLTRSSEGWKTHQRLPDDLELDIGTSTCRWAIGQDGVTYVVIWRESKKRLELWQGLGDAWSGQIVATDLPATPNQLFVRIDPSGRSVVLVGRLYEPFGWLKVLRPQN